MTRTERRLTRTMHAMSTGGTQGAAAMVSGKTPPSLSCCCDESLMTCPPRVSCQQFSDGFVESECPAALPTAPPILPPSMASSSFTSASEDAPSKPAAPQVSEPMMSQPLSSCTC